MSVLVVSLFGQNFIRNSTGDAIGSFNGDSKYYESVAEYTDEYSEPISMEIEGVGLNEFNLRMNDLVVDDTLTNLHKSIYLGMRNLMRLKEAGKIDQAKFDQMAKEYNYRLGKLDELKQFIANVKIEMTKEVMKNMFDLEVRIRDMKLPTDRGADNQPSEYGYQFWNK